MSENSKQSAGLGKVVRLIATGAAFTVVVIVMLLWLAGTFHPKVGDEHADLATQPAERPVPERAQVRQARLISISRSESAPGTVRAVHEVALASKLLAKVLEVNVKAGQDVERDEVLVRLEDADLEARLGQAKSALQQAKAKMEKAQIDHDRLKRLRAQNAASRIEWDRAQTALAAAKARVQEAKDAVAEAKTRLSYATIRSPIDGVVIDKQVEAGDTVSPGQVLVKLYDPERMQLVANVRESLARELRVEQSIGVRIEALDKTCQGKINEIVPEAEGASRTFAVKVTGPCPPGVYTGMFGRLVIPLGKEQVLVIPEGAVQRVGQLTLVDVVENGKVRRRAVELGRRLDEGMEVLAGLRPGERVAVPPA